MIAATIPAAARSSTPALPPKLSDHLSWSALTSYSMCPRKYELHYLRHANAEFIPSSLIFGGAFHRAVESVHQAQLEGRELPTILALVELYKSAWAAEVVPDVPIKYGKDQTADVLTELAERMLAAYREHASSQSGKILAIEHAHHFSLLPTVPPIEMHADLVTQDGGDIVITDVKTSRSKWSDARATEALGQLVLYSCGLAGLVKELGGKRLRTQFVVITKAAKAPAVQVVSPTPTQADVTWLKTQVAQTWDAIKAGSFPPRQSWACSQCPYCHSCLGQ